ncbi:MULTISPECIES: dynamin family protein [Spirulina sp. CCY15215]|uniref:dynamin family protein n=1 Tax=Spirulina sp. CCY15215 TaxID=2767591 RepID=UPI00194E93FA|nr:dynamin family protein [Spirulina major]
MLECSRSVNNVYPFNLGRAIALLNSMTPPNVTEILNSVRQLLNELGNGTEDLANAHPEVFDDPELKAQVEAFRSAYEEARERLENPTLSIATLGTTSSGKSTIVNALIGRRIAPILNTEMSGGILRLRVSDGSRLVIEETEHPYWETGEWSGLSDDELYSRIRSVMLSYHDIRKKEKNCFAPQITNYGALLPAGDRALLDLPAGIDIEIIDLPGLKSVQDRANLQVIQPQVRKSCSLVALDYGQVDEEKRERLLEELKEVVTALNGRTDSMIFLLNRVDMRGADDFPLEQQIERLQREIQSVLSLKTPPDIIPFCARLLYYAQCAWGTRNGDLSSQVSQETRLKLLKAMFEDCAVIITQSTRGNKELRRWFRGIEDDVDDGEAIDDETMRKILHYALEWSGGEQLWDTLRQRVQDVFPQLVVVPILIKVFNNFDSLITKINTIAEISKIEELETIKELQETLEQSRKKLHKKINKSQKVFFEDFQDIRKDLKENTNESRNRAIEKIEQVGIQGFSDFTESVKAIKDDILLKLIRPVREVLNKKQSVYDLEDKLQEIIVPSLANQIARAYDLMRSNLVNYKKDSGYFVFSARVNDQKEIQKVDHAEKAVRTFFETMKQAIVKRAEFSLQAKAKDFEDALRKLAKSNVCELSHFVSDELPDLELDQAIFAEFEQKISIPLELDEQVFDFLEIIQSDVINRSEEVDRQTKRVTYTEGSCLNKQEKTKIVSEPIIGEVEYRELKIPNFDRMAKQWIQGVENAESKLWDKLGDWVVRYLDEINDKFNESIEEVLELANRMLKEKETVIEQSAEESSNRWSEIESQQNLLKSIRQQLTSITVHL